MGGKNRLAIVLIAVVAIAFAFAVRDLSRLRGASPIRNMVDFAVFYCAGGAVDRGRTPYDVASIRSCEHRLGRGAAWSDPNYAMYAPLPPYDFVPFAALARVPYPAAKLLDLAAIAIAVVASALALRAIGVPAYVAVSALALSDGFIGMYLGQLYPITIALVALSAAALRRNNDAAAGAIAALTVIQPQIGAFVCCALFAWVPRSRVALAITIAALVSLGALALGPASLYEWFATAVPTQAGSEIHFWSQYSLTVLLGQFGLPARAAMLAGSASALLMLAVGLYLGRRLSRTQLGRPAIALVPAACSVIGGSYVHLGAIAVAVLAALIVVASDQRRSVAPLAVLGVPWPFVQDVKALFLSAALTTGIVVFGLRGWNKRSVALFAVLVAAMYAFELHPPADVAAGATTSVTSGIDPWRIVAKLPTIGALLALLYQFVAVALSERGVRTSSEEALADTPCS